MKFSDKLKYYLLLASLKLVALLPLSVLYGISNGIRYILEHCLHYRHKIIDQNLSTSFPEKSPEELNAIKHEFYCHLSDVIVESIKLLHISNKTLDKRIEVVNAQLIDRIGAQNRPIMLMLGHYCNWEWVPDVSRFYSPQTTSMHIYKPLRSLASDKLFLKIRNRFNSIGIPQTEVLRTLMSMAHSHPRFMVGFIADHRANSSVSHFHVDFLNHSTPVTVAAEPIGRKINAAFVYLDVEKTSRGHYRMTFKEMTPSVDSPGAYTTEYFHMLEATIRRQPPYWLWSHRRWLYK